MNDPTLAIHLFGAVSATIGDEPVDVGPPKCQTVLAALALSAGSPVPLGRLAELVWETDPPASAERTLQSYIARLRSSLGSAVITRHGSSYCLDVPANSVDVARFEHHLDKGRVADALAEWKGTPLDGLTAPGLDPPVTALTERWLGAVEVDLERRIETDPAAAIAELTELTAQHPFREGLWALLMTALYKSGRQADALAAYSSAHEHLVEQLGLEPGPRLQDLEHMILGHDERLGPDQPVKVQQPGRPSGTVTFAFTEVENATQSWASNPSATTAAMARLHEVVQATAGDHSGFVFSAVDDTLGVAFTSPEAAVEWATELHAAVRSEPWPAEMALRVRVGINTGGAEQHVGGYYGPAVNLATRLAGIGHGDQTVISNATAALLDQLELRELGTYRLDEIVTDQRIYQLGTVQHPPLRTESAQRGNVPRRLGRLIGRDDTLAAIGDALTAYPIVTLVGPGGIGKTQLALATANTLTPTDEAWLIELANIRSGEHLPRAVADTLGIQDRPGETLTGAITQALENRHALVVLDNCEHIIDDAAALAHAIIQHCPNVGLLATSRERLGLTNERVLTVTPLEPTTSAVELFNERAAAITPGFDPDTSRAAIAEICARLEGLPLAIELAAARTTSLTPAELLERLDRHHSLRLLTGGPRTSSDRHQTLQAAIRWSYDLLSPPEKALFQQLSIFTFSFDLPAAEAVATDEALDAIEVDRLLGHLVDQSMLTIESGPFGRRFRFLEPIHDFATDRLDDSGHADRVAVRHTQWCLTQVTDIGRQLAGWDEIEGVAQLEELWPNLRTVFDRACTSHDRHLAKRLVRPILGEIVLRGQHELGDWVERILAITPADDEDTIVFGLYWAAHRYTVTQNPDGYQRLVSRYGEPDHVLITHARAFVTRDYQTMAECLPAVAAELRLHGDHHLAERVDISVATALLHLGRYQEQEELAHRLIDRYRHQGPPTYLNWSLTQLGFNASFQRRPDRADTYFNQAIEIPVPPRTHTPNRPIEARRAFRQGQHHRAFGILRSHIDDMAATDNIQAGLLDCIEFINMMTTINRLPDATRILDYLETTGLFDTPAFRTLVADSTAKLTSATNKRPGDVRRPDLNHQQALKYMTEVLDQLADQDDDAGPARAGL